MTTKLIAKSVLATKKIKNWITWEVEFKKDTSDEEKTTAFLALHKYILDYLQKSYASNAIVNFIGGSVKPGSGKDRKIIGLDIGLGKAAGGAYSTITPPPPPPIQELLALLINKIKPLNSGR